MVFSDTVDNLGIVQQTRSMMRVDATQWPTYKIVNSCNNWLDTITGFAIGADRKFQWDDTNHTKLPIGTMSLVAGQTDYSFLTDEQGNTILNLLAVSLLHSATGRETKLSPVDIADQTRDFASFGVETGTPREYDKIADNIVRLDRKPSAADVSAYLLKLYFQRTASYFTASDTSKEPGVSPLLHRGFVIASAYDGALTLGLMNLQPLSVELQKEEKKMKDYFKIRNTDVPSRLEPFIQSNK